MLSITADPLTLTIHHIRRGDILAESRIKELHMQIVRSGLTLNADIVDLVLRLENNLFAYFQLVFGILGMLVTRTNTNNKRGEVSLLQNNTSKVSTKRVEEKRLFIEIITVLAANKLVLNCSSTERAFNCPCSSFVQKHIDVRYQIVLVQIEFLPESVVGEQSN